MRQSSRTAFASFHAFLHRPEHERVAAVAPRLVGSAGTQQQVVWPLPTPGRMWAGGGWTRPRCRHGHVCRRRRAASAAGGHSTTSACSTSGSSSTPRRLTGNGARSRADGCRRWTWTSSREHAGAGTSIDRTAAGDAVSRRAADLHHEVVRPRAGALYRVAACLGAAVARSHADPRPPQGGGSPDAPLLSRASSVRRDGAEVDAMPRVLHIVVTDAFAGVERYVC